MRSWYRAHRPEIWLVALAITIPELLTGSTPVWNLVDPIAVLGLLGLYGAGALLIRDVTLRWKKGWATTLLLGLAYGIAEEGFATKTMVDPQGTPAAFLGTYGHFLGVNWVFAVVIAIFHAVYSISLPILLVDLKFPDTRGHRFLTDRGEGWALAALAVTVAFGYLAFVPGYFEGYGVLLALGGALLALVGASRALPEWVGRAREGPPSLSPRAFLGLGLSFSLLWLFFYLPAPHLVPDPWICVAGEIATAVGVWWLFVSQVGTRDHEPHLVMFSIGATLWLAPWGVLVTFSEADDLVLLVTAAFFVGMWRLLRYSELRTHIPGEGSAPRSAPS